MALVVTHIERVLARLGPCRWAPGPVEEFPAEGTRETYIGAAGEASRLLLIQPVGEAGPYARTLATRGPGLHHVAYQVPSLEEHLAPLRGWLLHPRSLQTIARARTAWLARPGIATLLEIHEVRDAPPAEGARVVEALEVPVQPGLEPLLEPYGLLAALDGRAHLVIDGLRLDARDLAQ